MKTYAFKVGVEPDDDRWTAYCPALVEKGGATWSFTIDEALKHIQEVIHLVMQSLIRDGEAIPLEPKDDVQVTEEPLVSVMA